MEKAFEFNLRETEFKKFLEECLADDNITYEIKIEDKWHENVTKASKFYQVYCLYVNHNDLNRVKQFKEDFRNGTFIIDDIDELKNAEDEEEDNRFKIFTSKNFFKYVYGAFAVIAILIIIGLYFSS